MKVRSAALAIVSLGLGTLGCDIGAGINFDGLNFGFGGCGDANSPQCQSITVMPSSVFLLLGDTVALSATNGANQTDFTWESPKPAIAQADQATITSGGFGYSYSRVVVTANAPGTATIVARRNIYSYAATINVIPPSSVASFVLKKNRCPSYAAAWCDPQLPSGAPDTVHVGDTITVGGLIRDVDQHDVVATINWSSSNSSVVQPTIASDAIRSVQAVAAKGVGTATVRGTVAGLSQLFVVTVVK